MTDRQKETLGDAIVIAAIAFLAYCLATAFTAGQAIRGPTVNVVPAFERSAEVDLIDLADTI